MIKILMKGYKKILSVFLILIFPGLTLVLSQTGQYKFRHITPKDGLPSTQVRSILKDSRGFMWFSTGTGLYKYDGYDFKVYPGTINTSSSLSSDLLTGQLFIDTAANLWIGTKKQGLNILNTITGEVTQYKYLTDKPGSLSHNNVKRIFQDRSGTIWIATLGGGLNKFIDLKSGFVSYLPEHDSALSYSNSIQAIIEYNDGNLLVGTKRGPYIFNKTSQTFHPWEKFEKQVKILKNEIIVDIIKDDNTFWIATENGLFKYNNADQTMIRYISDKNDKFSLTSNTIQHMIESPDKSHLWISTVWGLNRFDKQTARARQYLYDKNNPNSLGYNMLWYLYIDNMNLLWIGTDNAGANVLDLNENPIQHQSIGNNNPYGEQYTATVFTEDKDQNIWIGTFDGGLWNYDPALSLLDKLEIKQNLFSETSIFSLCNDSENNIWVGTSRGNLYGFKQDDFKRYQINNGEQHKQAPSVIEIIEDKQGILWIGTIHGLYYHNTSEDETKQINVDPLNSCPIRTLYNDKAGNLWIGTHGEGLFKLEPEGRETLQFTNFLHEPNDQESVSSNTIMSLYQDHNDSIWIATNQGLNQYISETNNFKRIGVNEGLEIASLFHIQGDKNGVLWITYSNGLIRYEPNTHKSKIIEFGGNLSTEDIYPYSFYLSKTGIIYIGGKYGNQRGFYKFDPNSLKSNTIVQPIAITNFTVRNSPFTTDSAINIKKHLQLTYDQGYFSFEFATLDFITPNKNKYAYSLEGFDEGWNSSGTRRFASYTDIPPGDYIFKVKGSNNDGYWNEEGTSIMLTIAPPPWLTWWAYALYTLFVAALIIAWRRYDLKRLRLKQALEIEQMEAEKLKELDKMKSRFFANISHEFRTPLTLILGPLEKLKSKIIDQESDSDLSMMQRNARRLQNLINQLLSLSKLESGQMKLQASEKDAIPLIRGYLQSFESLAKQKGIQVVFRTERDSILLWFDQDKLEKILYNLLSNAFKFTGEGGEILVEIQSSEFGVQSKQSSYFQLPASDFSGPCVSISISDTGPGIPPEKLPHIFDRFYQADDNYTKDQEGTGIGLALTKELVDLHHGTITVDSEQGKGTTFTVFLPTGKDHLKPEELDTIGLLNETADSDVQFNQIAEVQNQVTLIDDEDGGDDTLPLLLIVEDNDDLRSYIRSYLRKDFRISEADNGKTGLEKAIDKIPDLVISDVMMPKMDGYELCNKLKTDERTSHIPVILLTARAGKESKIEGLETGADDFITKPFDPQELLVRINNLINQREKLKEKFKSRFVLHGDPEQEKLIPSEDKFLKKAKLLIDKNLADPELSVEWLSVQLAMSKSQFYRKLKAVIGLSPNEFIRTIRLNKAALLLSKRTGNVADIAYEVGFNNPSYFSECFQKQFGKLPSEYMG